jgi:hypothetical protein
VTGSVFLPWVAQKHRPRLNWGLPCYSGSALQPRKLKSPTFSMQINPSSLNTIESVGKFDIPDTASNYHGFVPTASTVDHLSCDSYLQPWDCRSPMLLSRRRVGRRPISMQQICLHLSLLPHWMDVFLKQPMRRNRSQHCLVGFAVGNLNPWYMYKPSLE